MLGMGTENQILEAFSFDHKGEFTVKRNDIASRKSLLANQTPPPGKGLSFFYMFLFFE